MNRFDRSRRQFLRTASMASMAGMYASPFLLELNSLAAMAQGAGTIDYRALVCVFLQGGNDGHGTVIATDPDSYSAFSQARSGASGLAYPMSELLPINLKTPQSGRTFALNPALVGLQNLFNAGRAGIVANTGTLIAPATKAQVNASSGSSASLLVLTFRSDCYAWQAIISNGGWSSAEHVRMGRRGCRSDRKHRREHEFELPCSTCISTAGMRALSTYPDALRIQLNVTSRRADSDLWPRAAIVRAVHRIQCTRVYPHRG